MASQYKVLFSRDMARYPVGTDATDVVRGFDSWGDQHHEWCLLRHEAEQRIRAEARKLVQQTEGLPVSSQREDEATAVSGQRRAA